MTVLDLTVTCLDVSLVGEVHTSANAESGPTLCVPNLRDSLPSLSANEFESYSPFIQLLTVCDLVIHLSVSGGRRGPWMHARC
jgi:hypothetical protein